jgi:homoserine O-succinyltransferase
MSVHIDHPPSAPPPAAARAVDAAVPAPIRIGIVNNMPDSALESTEVQFNSLLAAASGATRVEVRYFSLPELPRAAEARARVEAQYWSIDALEERPPDALIVTGNEPRATSLPEEPYWNRLRALLDFAERETVSSAWSCLAAHAAVLALSGVERQRLPRKRFGVFEHDLVADDPLTAGLAGPLSTPHSRWNDLPEPARESAGYSILSRSEANGVDLFARHGTHTMLFFQGHPEYEDRTLLKEYQRDVGRYISGEYASYPVVPEGYFSEAALRRLAEFERCVKAGKLRDPRAEFPFTAVAATLGSRWRAQAVRLYSNWLGMLAGRVPRRAPVSTPGTRYDGGHSR